MLAASETSNRRQPPPRWAVADQAVVDRDIQSNRIVEGLHVEHTQAPNVADIDGYQAVELGSTAKVVPCAMMLTGSPGRSRESSSEGA